MNDINFTMYKLAGIIAEYDPFHNGHAWQLQQAKALGARRVAVAMSCAATCCAPSAFACASCHAWPL